jgi:hypothetical protein
MRTCKIGINGADLAPVSTVALATLEDVQLELAIEALRRERVETERAEETVKEYAFRRAILVVVLCILGLVAAGSLAVIAAGLVASQYPLAAGAVAPLSGSGAFSVLAWRTYIGGAAHGAI